MKNGKEYAYLLKKLESAGFEAYIVGGCVRDALLGREVNDCDITTSAIPEQIMGVFSELKVAPTGLKHGTVTVIYNDMPFEVTTFRVDGSYTDSRRPDSVSFTASLEEDLARRDFTVNAMAMDVRGELHDPFGGRDDLAARVIRCVGAPEKRFREDALRIMRAVRFASTLGFEIEERTSAAALELRGLLDNISRERCRDELSKMIMGENLAEVALKFRDIIAQVIPELRTCFDFEQRSRYHKYTVYEHIVRAVAAAPPDPTVRTAMLFHDIGKPQMFTLDEDGVGHFKGHAEVSAKAAEVIMRRLRWENAVISDVSAIIARHSDKISSEKQIKRLISRLGEDNFFRLLEAKKADNLAKNEFVLTENAWFDECAELGRRSIEESACMSLRDLAVNGNDIMSLGAEGRQVGECLRELLDLVIDGELPNEREALLCRAREVLA
ncbi:MAG: CCA tRNA nucleotidyltransferase [Ruminococcus sp.]|nr:CCA tRNA nucleotidyltransferase [Ruminococcus sp.]